MNIEKNNLNPSSQPSDSQPQYKIIQDYIYKFTDQIGSGNFSKVFKGYHQINKQQFAIKIIQLNSLNNIRLQQLLNTEIKILKTLSHPNVITCQQILSSARNCYIIMQLCNGGDLQKKLKKLGKFQQPQLYPIAFDIYQGLKYLAKKHIIHRDLKTSNIFINNGVHKIADFGFAHYAQKDFRDISVGSPIFMSPQGYINNLYGPKTDVWAFGVVLYELIQGKTPCHNCQNQSQLKTNLMKQIDYSNFSSAISNQLKNLIILCLNINSSTRINILDIQNTQWMQKVYKIINQNNKINSNNNNQFIQNTIKQKKDYKKLFLQQLKKKQQLQQQPFSNSKYINKIDSQIHLRKFLKDPQQKNYYQNTKKKNFTLEKTQHKFKIDQDSIFNTLNNQTSKIFYSPKNLFNTPTRTFNSKHQQPSSKFQPYHRRTNIKSPQNLSIKLKDKNTTIQNLYNHHTNNNQQKNNNLQQKNHQITNFSSSKQVQNVDNSQQLSPNNYSNVQSCINYNSNQNCYKQTKQDVKQFKRPQRFTLQSNSKNLLKPPFTLNSPLSKNYQIFSPKSLNGKMKISEFFETKVFKPSNMNKSQQKPTTLSKNLKNQQPLPNKIINRSMKFSDCIGLIHYCRLCYKLTCLLNQYGQSQQIKKQLTNWSVQLLTQLNNKIDKNQIIYNNQLSIINSPSINLNNICQKKKKLTDVAKQYLHKYRANLKFNQLQFITANQVSNFIQNLYKIKNIQFKQKLSQIKSYLYYALQSYLYILNNETKTLIQFINQKKSILQTKSIQKLLIIKIHQFNQKYLNDIYQDNTENLPLSI